MHVIKRDGRRVEVAFDKITARIKKLSYGLHPEHCDRYVCANKNVFVFFLLLLLYLLGSVVYSKNEGWWRLTRRVLRRHEACARGLPSFETFWRHSLLDSRPFQPRLFPNWRDIWRRYNNHERIEEAYGSFFFLFWIIREISTRWASMERFLSAFLLELRSKTRPWRIRSRFVDISRSRDDMRTANTKSSFSKISTGKQLTLRRRVACFKTFEKMRKKSSDWPNSSFFYS